MSSSRRDFLRSSFVVGAGLALGAPSLRVVARARPSDPSARKMRILILGGTGFLGPHIVEWAQQRGHTLTLFNRGRTNAHLFPDVEKLVGDRDGDLEALKGREWDAVIDTSGYVPRIVRESAALLKGSVGHYVFISSVSVYADLSEPNADERTPVGTMEDETIEQITGGTYGPLKALCEQAAESVFPGRATNIRPGLIVGPGDPTDRYTYWPVRVARGGEVLAPGTPNDPTQIIDVRDLAAWCVHVVEKSVFGVFNAVGPGSGTTMGELLGACREAGKSDATFTWVDAEFLSAQGVQPWSHMPAWVPPVGEYTGFGRVSNAAAMRNGLKSRPQEETARDTLAWHNERPPERREKLRAGITPEREAEVLKAWRERNG